MLDRSFTVSNEKIRHNLGTVFVPLKQPQHKIDTQCKSQMSCQSYSLHFSGETS